MLYTGNNCLFIFLSLICAAYIKDDGSVTREIYVPPLTQLPLKNLGKGD